MSRKAFSSDLDSVFAPGAQYEPNIDNSPWLTSTVAEAPAVEAPSEPSSTRTRTATRRTSRKSFAPDLESLFRAASVERPSDPRPAEDPTARQRERPRRGLSALAGIDALIRDTTDGKAIAQQDAREAEARRVGVPKRVTFTYDRDQFARLKEIAREEGAYLKDIISGLLNDYVSEYEAQVH